jgi:hypothetical protein
MARRADARGATIAAQDSETITVEMIEAVQKIAVFRSRPRSSAGRLDD